MKKKISCALLALLLAGQVMGAVSVEATRTETGYQTKELLVPQFEDCMGISDDGILAVRKGDKWGFVDVNGQTLLDYKYDYVTPMRDGIAVIGYKSEKDPYVDKETGKSYDYYILYLVDKTGKETQLFVVEEQQYRIDMFPTDANGNHYVELHQNGWSNINIENGVVQINDYLFYKYDGTPIYAKDQEKRTPPSRMPVCWVQTVWTFTCSLQAKKA